MKFALSFLLFAAAAIAADLPQPVLHWKLDGNPDEAGGAVKGENVGRVVYFDSPIGDGGQLASLNGIDASIKIPPQPARKVPEGDLTISLWMFAFDKRDATLIANGDSGGEPGFRLATNSQGELIFHSSSPAQTAHATSRADANPISTGRWNHVAVVCKRDGNNLVMSFLINLVGRPRSIPIEVAPKGNSEAAITIGNAKGNDKPFFGLIDDVQVFDKALAAEQLQSIVDAGIPWLRNSPERTATPAGWKDGKFALRNNDVVAFVGGEDMVALQETGQLEALLLVHGDADRVFFRNMSWEGDTVYEQARLLNFGSWKTQFERTGTTVIVAQFGQMESLQGKSALPAFKAAYEKLLDDFSAVTKRIVIVSPHMFEPVNKDAKAVTDARNADLKEYCNAISKLAKSRGLVYCNFFDRIMLPDELLYTRDGVHLNDDGFTKQSIRILLDTGILATLTTGEQSKKQRALSVKLRLAIIEKNRLWTDYWRPSNWAFLAGDRTEQPSSRDHADPRIRWFPAEVQKYPALIKREEEKIWKLAAEIQK